MKSGSSAPLRRRWRNSPWQYTAASAEESFLLKTIPDPKAQRNLVPETNIALGLATTESYTPSATVIVLSLSLLWGTGEKSTAKHG